MIWVLDHLADLESDLSRFHRIDDMYQLDGPKFFRLAWRLSTYGGVMAMRLEQQREANAPTQPSAPAVPRAPSSSSPGRTRKHLTAVMAELPGLIEKKKAG